MTEADAGIVTIWWRRMVTLYVGAGSSWRGPNDITSSGLTAISAGAPEKACASLHAIAGVFHSSGIRAVKRSNNNPAQRAWHECGAVMSSAVSLSSAAKSRAWRLRR